MCWLPEHLNCNAQTSSRIYEIHFFCMCMCIYVLTCVQVWVGLGVHVYVYCGSMLSWLHLIYGGRISHLNSVLNDLENLST